MAKMLLLDVEKQELREVEANNLEDYYNLLNCRTIDIVNRPIISLNDKIEHFDIICDDEGLLKEHNLVSAFDFRHRQIGLVGNLLISKFNKQGDEISLSDTDLEFVKNAIVQIPFEALDEENGLTIRTKIKVLSLWM